MSCPRTRRTFSKLYGAYSSVSPSRFMRTEGVTPCFKGNKFNHSAPNCMMPARWLQVLLVPIPPMNVTSPVRISPSVVNCGSKGHTAAWTKCLDYSSHFTRTDYIVSIMCRW
ncbi:hypothetical protein JTE90_000680 [Oedothorax gibbosus]|uniref:Uncharacterized protein n=1 Tax=Oedothorax gibbosus TaxID=931172 RepID=A0AAV6TM33_9ARAC|nr:hypothetical protein JTE90_000680 [Oedothorax gibbosus]